MFKTKQVLLIVCLFCFFTSVLLGETVKIEKDSERVIHFPKDRSLGQIWVQDNSVKRQIENFHHWIDAAEWEYFCQARGDITVSPGQRLYLRIGKTPSMICRRCRNWGRMTCINSRLMVLLSMTGVCRIFYILPG